MNLVVCGLSPREEAAFDFFLKRSMSGWSWRSAPPGRDVVLPEADVLVVDMTALGLGQHSPETEAALLKAIHGTPAVLLLPSHDRTWAALDEAVVQRLGLVRLSRPYGSEAMRLALEQAAAVGRARSVAPARGAPPVSPRAPEPSAAVPVRVAVGTPRAAAGPVPGGGAMARPSTATPDERPGLSPAGLCARVAATAHPPAFMRQLAELLMQGRPFEVRLTIQNAVIFHPADNWVSSNTPLGVFRRVCQSDALASVLSVREIDGAAAEDRTQQLGMQVRELEEFLAELVQGMALATPPSGEVASR